MSKPLLASLFFLSVGLTSCIDIPSSKENSKEDEKEFRKEVRALETIAADTNHFFHNRYKDVDVHVKLIEVIDYKVKQNMERNGGHWYHNVNDVTKTVQQQYLQNFKICLDVVKVEEWYHENGSLDELLYDLKFIPPEDAAVVVGLTSKSNGEILIDSFFQFSFDQTLGIAELQGNHMVVAFTPAEPTAQIYVHEMGHIFGVGHVDDESSIMYPFVKEDAQWDSQSKRTILLQKYRSWDTADEIKGLYALIKKVDTNSSKQLKGLHRLMGKEAWADARKIAQSLLQKYPQEGYLYFTVGEICTHQGDLENGIEAYEKALQIGTAYAALQNNLAYDYLEAGKHVDRALTLAKQACTKQPAQDAFRDTLGWAYYNTGSYNEAERELLKVTSLMEAEYQLHLGMTYDKLSKRDKAKAAFLMVLRLDETGKFKKIAKQKLKEYNNK